MPVNKSLFSARASKNPRIATLPARSRQKKGYSENFSLPHLSVAVAHSLCVGLKFNPQNPKTPARAYRAVSGAPASVLMLNNHTTTFINYDSKYV
jgi:hypothetical protein